MQSTTNLLVPVSHCVMHLEIHQSNKQQKTKVHLTISFYKRDIFWKGCNINLLLHSTFTKATTRPNAIFVTSIIPLVSR